ncbi:MAG: hypothetical protein NC548_25600 [Lachnospiraceae bacterium]|nr:hypothetical protein [Lachnospiraceae bacterium]
MFEWGDFENADTDVFPPDASYTRHTLSAEEILELISWGDLAKLKLQDKFDSLIWGELGVDEIPEPEPDIPEDKDNSLLWGDMEELDDGGN